VVKADQLSLVQADQHEAHLIHLKDVSDMKPQPVMKANHPSLVRADQREAHLADQPSLVRADQRDREKANHPSLVRADHREAHLADQPSLVRADQLEAHLAGQPSLVRADQRETHLVHHLVPSVEKVRHVHQNLHVISPSHNERHGKSRAQNVSRFPRVSGSDVACLFTKPDAIGTTDEFEESNEPARVHTADRAQTGATTLTRDVIVGTESVEVSQPPTIIALVASRSRNQSARHQTNSALRMSSIIESDCLVTAW